MMNLILEEDLAYTWRGLSDKEREKLRGATILITGCGGFLGQYYLSFFEKYGACLNIKKVIGIDTFILGASPLISRLQKNLLFDIRTMDVAAFSDAKIAKEYHIDYVLHMASIASPTYYRQHPLETIDSNIWGIRALLDAFSKQQLKGFLFYSSSEIYGDPSADNVPTAEECWGNVSCVGPRACYDESKRFGETLCWVYHKVFGTPIRIVRLFNVYGPCLKLNDCRAPADFARSVIENRDIVIFSNGQPQRTFCYVADSAIGEIKALLSDGFEVYNIGSDAEELSIERLAQLYRDIGAADFNYTGNIVYASSKDADYLVHNPQRRRPDVTKARRLLGYSPTIDISEGVYRYLSYLRKEGAEAIW